MKLLNLLNKKSSTEHPRRKSPLFLRFFLFTLVGLSLFVFALRSDRVTTFVFQTLYGSREEAVDTTFAAPPVISHTVKSGDTFGNILQKCPNPGDQTTAYCQALREQGLNTLYPGDSVVLTLNQDSSLQHIAFLSRLRQWFTLDCTVKPLRARAQKVPTTTYQCLVRGRLNSSLSEDLAALGVGDAVVAQLTEIFAWDINFFVDPRKGDRFEIIFEREFAEGRSLGSGKILAARYFTGEKQHCAIALDNQHGGADYFTPDGKSVQKQFLKAPLKYSRISSGYTFRRKHPVLGIVRPHLGIDYAAPRGTPIHSAADGIIAFKGWRNGFGNLVVINHGASYSTMYGHLHKFASAIRQGKHVQQGQCIGTVGATGLATGPHLDYRMKRGSAFINPLAIQLPSKQSVSAQDAERFAMVRNNLLLTLDTRLSAHHQGCWVLHVEQPSEEPPSAQRTALSSATQEHYARPPRS